MKKRSKTVSFRLSEDLHAKLAAEGSSTGLSVGELARTKIVALLMGEDIEERDGLKELHATLEQVESHQRAMSKRLAYLLYSVLTNVGKFPPVEAKEIVRRDLVKREDA